MTKLLENTFRAVNIALANEFADVCHALGMDVMEVIDAAATKPYGFMPFYPGPGVGGHCIPCDPHYLLWQLRAERVEHPGHRAGDDRDRRPPASRRRRVRQVLADRGTALFGARILVVGIAYKPDVADVRESPALEIIERLHAAGAIVAFHDPYFDHVVLRNGTVVHHTAAPRQFGADLVVLHTAHVASERSWLAEESAVLDTTYRGTDVPQRVLL